MSCDLVLPFSVPDRPVSACLRGKYAAIIPFIFLYQSISYLHETISQLREKNDQAI